MPASNWNWDLPTLYFYFQCWSTYLAFQNGLNGSPLTILIMSLYMNKKSVFFLFPYKIYPLRISWFKPQNMEYTKLKFLTMQIQLECKMWRSCYPFVIYMSFWNCHLVQDFPFWIFLRDKHVWFWLFSSKHNKSKCNCQHF